MMFEKKKKQRFNSGDDSNRGAIKIRLTSSGAHDVRRKDN